ncbi:MAG: N-formylglutamate deformylase [Burkholderiales bacterium]|nr:N-formylglutamate deformylase [Burkholderiales bacterium]MDE1929900.1 N-formylglutamate deformylase [Burkholderiales bacterium]MDE2158296.1 N-formylglutamate deformylase [Burkholderiales bacterium]MDE2502814.1 N-formylglutamate deformylase [Burkholderiales bacterium]
MSDSVYTLQCGQAPLLISVPHVGTGIPPELAPDYTERALAVEDTDWYLDRLYAFAVELGASLIVPRYSRYVIDLNRPRANTPMYAGQNNTELCPTRHFTGEPIYRPGRAPGAAEIERRVGAYWQPYRTAIAAELERIRAAQGHAVLFDAHSIRSELPWLFEGRLPHLNLGTVGATSCGRGLRLALSTLLAAQQRYTHVVDGRFRGGDLTRTHGRPAEGLHAVQLEMCWRCYLDEEAPPRWDAARAAEVTPLLRALVRTMMAWKP